MGEPQRIGWGDTAVAAEHAKQDRLVARIEDEDRISGWCWAPMLDTLANLRELPGEVSWCATRYLQAVIARGDAVFGDPAHYQQSMFEQEHRTGIQCRCGATAHTDRPTRRGGRSGGDVVVAVCGSCGISLAMFDGEPYPHRTLLSAAFPSG